MPAIVALSTALSSPIRLHDDSLTIRTTPRSAPPAIKHPLKPPCPPTRRRAKSLAHTLRRRRNLPRVECRTDPPAAHIFDQLPWIAALDAPPVHINPWDIADLSQISTPGPGPVRRRKSASRSSPIASSHPLPEPLPLVSPPQTPPSRFNPSRVLFHHLMPVSFDPSSTSNDAPFLRHCTTSFAFGL